MTPEDAKRILAEADLIHSAAEVMGGAVIFAGQLLPQLAFPLECDYVHATRYGKGTSGGDLKWLKETHVSVTGRTVLVLDDILDEGITLAAIRCRLLEQGAAMCLTAVLADKQIGRSKPIAADFVGLPLPDRYVFGCGMDVEGAWRNLPTSGYAIKLLTRPTGKLALFEVGAIETQGATH